ncbi:conjugal transfer protein TrbJ [Ralstonia solanacearum]|uniref:conjugal transfer protein TrbJ n=1 Tax=Ralstonia solanacearum TaxID=305 RepID=UPI0016810246|nr:conjugal transfer protein TrbJ [Ralstonia solanacearum]MBB6592734.1 conjugal transfer protein TrbJ [Ralstonia solanacearum]MBB6596956.1 conjugal transfer protein TrbJ [Ralstonia solanacearum]MDB0541200.1 conjugal transfer protein TrbJ [Ralstonia solanacearum]MDB0551426.1 conjugal transfer protein TrbJ [Ralstonia solanacearum]MDB0556149.1 conjugal transfer protein TrbJ [Ralstonia solanacearum]
MLKTDFPATLWKVHATLVVAACAVALSSPAHASGWPVFDGANFLKNAISAAQALKTEVYENTNIIYQYKMMLNQLQQAVGLDDVKNQAQIDSIQADVKRYSDYGQVLEQLYGAVSNDSSFLDRVNGLVVQSGKSPAQWFEDQRTLLTSGNKTAQALFNAGTDVSKNVARLAQRRQDLQSQMTLSPTAQATAQTTNQYLDLLSSQNADLIKLIGTKVQADAVKDRKENADTEEKTAAMQNVISSQDTQLQKLRQSVYTRSSSAQ